MRQVLHDGRRKTKDGCRASSFVFRPSSQTDAAWSCRKGIRQEAKTSSSFCLLPYNRLATIPHCPASNSTVPLYVFEPILNQDFRLLAFACGSVGFSLLNSHINEEDAWARTTANKIPSEYARRNIHRRA